MHRLAHEARKGCRPAPCPPTGEARASRAWTVDEGEGLNPDSALRLVNCQTTTRHILLQNAVGMLNQFGAEPQDVLAFLAEERLHLARRWRQLEITINLSRLQHKAAPRGREIRRRGEGGP